MQADGCGQEQLGQTIPAADVDILMLEDIAQLLGILLIHSLRQKDHWMPIAISQRRHDLVTAADRERPPERMLL